MADDANNQCAAMEELGLPKALVTTLIEDEGAVVLTALQTAICTEGRAGADLLVQVGCQKLYRKTGMPHAVRQHAPQTRQKSP